MFLSKIPLMRYPKLLQYAKNNLFSHPLRTQKQPSQFKFCLIGTISVNLNFAYFHLKLFFRRAKLDTGCDEAFGCSNKSDLLEFLGLVEAVICEASDATACNGLLFIYISLL
ncbi:hypothetical protein LOAG_15087 [Loa loa]|uniref:Uncharacterized protein n=1 Tax=Loa loa TaxID=7209 RepID=A0A1S0TGG2_LOALO|nr:hypothetical protein LOAG_15087 [Loa loa]EFO13442.1 hypothetical protein LOAG_15087 [Loa loa]